jgi:hypothetical protein
MLTRIRKSVVDVDSIFFSCVVSSRLFFPFLVLSCAVLHCRVLRCLLQSCLQYAGVCCLVLSCPFCLPPSLVLSFPGVTRRSSSILYSSTLFYFYSFSLLFSSLFFSSLFFSSLLFSSIFFGLCRCLVLLCLIV